MVTSQIEMSSEVNKKQKHTFNRFSDTKNGLDYNLLYGRPGSKFRTEKEAIDLLSRLSNNQKIEYTALSPAETYAAQYLESEGKVSIHFGEGSRTYVEATPAIVRYLLKILPL